MLQDFDKLYFSKLQAFIHFLHFFAKFFLTICITFVCYFDGVTPNIQFSIQVQTFLANCFWVVIVMNFCDGHGFACDHEDKGTEDNCHYLYI
jgi:hypothetical protein